MGFPLCFRFRAYDPAPFSARRCDLAGRNAREIVHFEKRVKREFLLDHFRAGFGAGDGPGADADAKGLHLGSDNFRSVLRSFAV